MNAFYFGFFVAFIQCSVFNPFIVSECVFVFTLCISLLFLWSNTNETVTNPPTSKQIDEMRERTNLYSDLWLTHWHTCWTMHRLCTLTLTYTEKKPWCIIIVSIVLRLTLFDYWFSTVRCCGPSRICASFRFNEIMSFDCNWFVGIWDD